METEPRPRIRTSGDRRSAPPPVLRNDRPPAENPDYLSRQLITYIGNKRALLEPIGEAVAAAKRRLGKTRLRLFDAFSGSGVVSRYFKAHASHVTTNDFEDYAAATSRCYLRNENSVDRRLLDEVVADLNDRVLRAPLRPGFIEELYAPKDEADITKDDRVFYTRENARRLDNYRRLIDDAPADLRDLLLGPLLSAASVHANTAGVFKGFYKNRHTRIGQFGGSGSDALTRIRGQIRLAPPVLSSFECDWEVVQGDANAVAKSLKGFDLAYVDPPYNQHPYGSNYFMLNLLLHYQRPTAMSAVSGIPKNWRRSGYNVRARSLALLRDLLESLDALFLLVSFNDEGFIAPDQMRSMLSNLGKVDVVETKYNAFRGSRSFENRPIHVTEQLFLVERR